MPTRRTLKNPTENAVETDVTKKPNTPYKELSAKDKLAYLAQVGLSYLSLKTSETKLKKEITTKNADLKEKIDLSKDLFDVNGNHLELHIPAGDGLNEVFIQLQGKESVSMVSDVVAQIKDKLGDKATPYIMTMEVLHENALEAMHNSGLLSDADIEDLTVTKKTESLIVKLNKKK